MSGSKDKAGMAAVSRTCKGISIIFTPQIKLAPVSKSI
jgi:hypothetical protein